MQTNQTFNIGDTVYFLQDNKIQVDTIQGRRIIECLDMQSPFAGNFGECGVKYITTAGIQLTPDLVFESREALVDSL